MVIYTALNYFMSICCQEVKTCVIDSQITVLQPLILLPKHIEIPTHKGANSFKFKVTKNTELS